MDGINLVLVVDDAQIWRRDIEYALAGQGCRLEFAVNGPEALQLSAALTPDLILLDVKMPGMDGFEVCQHLRADQRLAEVPIILITGLDDRDSRLRGLEAGADDFLSKPFDHDELRARVRTILRLNRYRRLVAERARFERLAELSPDGLLVVDAQGRLQLSNPAVRGLLGWTEAGPLERVDWLGLVAQTHRAACAQALARVLTLPAETVRLEVDLLRADGLLAPAEIALGHFQWDGQPMAQIVVRDFAERRRAAAQIQRLNADLLHAYDATLEGWSRALDMRDRETEGHTRRVTEMTLRLASALGFTDEQLVHVRRGALLHDIGKMGVPDAILLKPGPLTAEEWAIMRLHPGHAYQMLAPITFLRPALDIPYCHHERWDGRGYPRGLRGEAIPFAARVFTVVDVWDALRSHRPYRPAWPDTQVRTYLQAEAGRQFEARIVEAFLKLWNGGLDADARLPEPPPSA
ncbi:MAG: response regulator [Anaerolineales bacterium]|nr:response regulator [Anaerolineales bacterium]